MSVSYNEFQSIEKGTEENPVDIFLNHLTKTYFSKQQEEIKIPINSIPISEEKEVSFFERNNNQKRRNQKKKLKRREKNDFNFQPNFRRKNNNYRYVDEILEKEEEDFTEPEFETKYITPIDQEDEQDEYSAIEEEYMRIMRKNQQKRKNKKEEDIFQKLYTARTKKMKNNYLSSKEKEELKECTFQPKTNPTNKDMKIPKSKLWERKEKNPQKLSKLKNQEMKECTFQPKINKKGTIYGKNEEENVFERLTKQRKTKKKPRKKRGQNGTNKFAKKKKKEPSINQIDSSLSFLERLENDKKRRLRKRQLATEKHQHSFEPKINKKKIGRFSKENGLLKKNFFDRRNHYLLNKDKNLELKRRELEFQSECSFIPQRFTKRYKAHHEPGTFNSFEQSRIKDEREREHEEIEVFTFNPKTNTKKNMNIKSSLGIDLNVGDYVTKMKLLEMYKKRKEIQEKEERIRRELDECTFQPKINTVPKYIENIVRGIEKSKKETQIRPCRPKWI